MFYLPPISVMKYVLPVAFSLPAISAALCSYIFDLENILESYFLRKAKQTNDTNPNSDLRLETALGSAVISSNFSKENNHPSTVMNRPRSTVDMKDDSLKSLLFTEISNSANSHNENIVNSTITFPYNNLTPPNPETSYAVLREVLNQTENASKSKLNSNSNRARKSRKGFYYWRNVLIRWGVTKTAGLGYNIGTFRHLAVSIYCSGN